MKKDVRDVWKRYRDLDALADQLEAVAVGQKSGLFIGIDRSGPVVVLGIQADGKTLVYVDLPDALHLEDLVQALRQAAVEAWPETLAEGGRIPEDP